MTVAAPLPTMNAGPVPAVDLRARLSHVILLSFVAAQVFAGVLRWALGSVHLQALIYVPTLLVWGDIALVAIETVRARAISRATLWLTCLLVVGALTGLLSLPPQQVAFGTWVLTPLIYGYALADRWPLTDVAYRRAALVLLVLACIGIIGNAYIAYPWIGANFELGGKEIAGARDWSIGERQRLAGFARSSFDAAGQIAILAALYNVREPRRWLRGAIWLLAVTAVMLSTARGILLSMAVATLAIEGEHLGKRIVARAWLALGYAWMALPPLIAWTVDFGQEARLQLHSSHGSYLDRLANMWPQARDLWLGAPAPWLGRGLGGIGAAQTLFEPDRFNAADNLMVYQCVALGTLAFPLLACAAFGLWRIGGSSRADAATLCAFALIVVWYGAVSNVVEHPILAATYGLLLQRSVVSLRPRRST